MEEIVKLKNVQVDLDPSVHFRTGLVGTSDCNMFIPVYGLFGHELLIINDEIRVVEYTMPVYKTSGVIFRQYGDLLDGLTSSPSPIRYCFKYSNVEYEINVLKGIVYDSDGNILVCLGINSEYVLNTPMEILIENPDPNQFTLFISHAFNNEEKYKNIRRKLEALYFTPCKSRGMDLVQTSKIKEWLFKNNYRAPQFDTIDGMLNHLNTEIPQNLLID